MAPAPTPSTSATATCLNGVLGTLIFDGDAHIVELARQATAGDFSADLLNNLPNVFTGSDPAKAFIDRSGTVFLYDDPVLASIVFGTEAQPHLSGSPLITGNLQVRAVVLHAANVQERGVHERGVQKRTADGTLLWVGLNGNETIDGTQTGIPVIVRVAGPTAGQLVYLDADGNRVFTNTGVASIVTPIGAETTALVYRDAPGPQDVHRHRQQAVVAVPRGRPGRGPGAAEGRAGAGRAGVRRAEAYRRSTARRCCGSASTASRPPTPPRPASR